VQELLSGQVLDQYQVIDDIARSGMASLYRARDLDDGRTVVLKVPYPQYESDVVFHQRFRREEEIGLKLDYPAIIKVYKPRTKSRVYLALEYVEGETLRVRLERDLRGTPRLPVATAVEQRAAGPASQSHVRGAARVGPSARLGTAHSHRLGPARLGVKSDGPSLPAGRHDRTFPLTSTNYKVSWNSCNNCTLLRTPGVTNPNRW